MKRLMLLVVLVLGYETVSAASEDVPPFLYYYSSALRAIVVERADGTDSRALGEGLTLEAGDVGGPGWSPNGQWFAWYGINNSDYRVFTVPQAAAVRVDNQARLKSLDNFAGIQEMIWSPDSRYLFVRGQIGFRTAIRPTTFWIIDVSTDTLVVSTDMFVFAMMYTTPLEWQLSQQQIVLYLIEEEFVQSRKVRVTMHFDGSVLKEPIRTELYNEKSAYESPEVPFDQPLDSPSGRYIEQHQGTLTDT